MHKNIDKFQEKLSRIHAQDNAIELLPSSSEFFCEYCRILTNHANPLES